MPIANGSYSPYAPERMADHISFEARRILIFGESGIGKSTFAAGLARAFAKTDRPCLCIGADPGSPAFGVPGAVCLGQWRADDWRLLAFEALCTLDAGRFRLPLVSAVWRLSHTPDQGLLLVDAPGIVRGVAGAELFAGLVEAAEVDTVLALVREDEIAPLANELETSDCDVFFVEPSNRARLPRKRQRAGRRTRLWDSYLGLAAVRTLSVPEAFFTGTPPPLEAASSWRGRQVALLKQGRTLAMGEVLEVTGERLRVRMPEVPETFDQVLVRDAGRDEHGLLSTLKPVASPGPRYAPPDVAPYDGTERATGPRPVIRIEEATAVLVNGVLGDPLIHLRLHNRKRSLLFDLGEGGRLPARLAHQASDVFISHAHIDHIGGFLWLLRSRIGVLEPCRLFGPPGLSERISSLIGGIHWDRIGEAGPRFEVGELHGERLFVHALQAGGVLKGQAEDLPAPEGLLLDDPDVKVRAAALVHAGIPVLAYRLELAPKLNVLKARLAERNLPPGPWLGELKLRVLSGDLGVRVLLPDGSEAEAGALASDLIQVTPARTVVYATDLSDTPANREALTALARGAEVLFCEAAFLGADAPYAELSGHLTARACGEIAQAAGVKRVVPFHFSRRYEQNPLAIYDEVRAETGAVVVTS